MKTKLFPILLTSLSLWTVGCGDDLAGTWESSDSEDACSGASGEMDIDDDFQGSGSITIVVDTSYCYDAEFDIDASDNGDDSWDVEITFEDVALNGQNSFDLECDLDGDTLECDSDDIELDPYDSWERQE